MPDAPRAGGHQTTFRAIAAAALLVIGFWPILVSMYGSWFDERAYMEHGILVIPAAAYMVWTKKERLKTVLLQPSLWGLVLIVCGALLASLGVLAHWVWVSRMAFLVSLVGCIALIYGWRMIQQLVYPLCTLVLMIAPPTFLLARLTLSLQLLASRLGEWSLEALGISVFRDGNVLELVGIKLSVEEACSGIRSLMAILFMAVLYNYFFVQGKTMKSLILALCIPIAILGNAARIVATGVAGQYNPSLTQGTAHETLGYISVAVAAIGCMAVHIVMLSIQKVWRSRHA
ncbi:MAG TPA: exosortase/archaeosortase family protein [Bryobacteraceae bacterium]|nr:exosortase/archaeosortase family protein [Bryobacteraceae bacterium]